MALAGANPHFYLSSVADPARPSRSSRPKGAVQLRDQLQQHHLRKHLLAVRDDAGDRRSRGWRSDPLIQL